MAEFDTVVSTVGIMMGEAIAKPSLTLLNLSIEELAFLEHTNAEESLWNTAPAPYRDWRYIHIGGDDHLVKGPLPYLRRISDIHLRAGSHIDPGKHGYSRICVRYTERLINLLNLQYGKPFDPSDYSRSTIVDSVKVRLLERGQSTLILKDNKNVAIGKSAQLGGCIEWLPKDDRFYTQTKKSSIRDLFVERMGPLLPRKAVNPRCFAAMHLPTIVGGYGLGMKHELQSFLYASPEPTKGLIHKAFLGCDVKDDLKIFRKLNVNVASRGVESILKLQETIVSQLSDYPSMVNAITWDDVKKRFPDVNQNARKSIALAADEGILSFQDFAKRATRGNLFQELLMGAKGLSTFNTNPFVKTYNKYVWERAEEIGMLDFSEHRPLTNAEIVATIKDISPQWYFDINQMTSMDVGFWDPLDPETETWDFKDDTYINKYTEGFPSFNIGLKFLGLRR
jgi:hypothetical protein